MTIKNGDSPAMPLMLTSEMVELIKSNPTQAGIASGISKREQFAAMAMQGLLSNSFQGQHRDHKPMAADAVSYANALLEALESDK